MKQLISGSLDGCIMVWNFKPQLRAYRFAGHKEAVYSVDYSAQNGLLASGSKDKTVRLWQPTGRKVHNPKGSHWHSALCELLGRWQVVADCLRRQNNQSETRSASEDCVYNVKRELISATKLFRCRCGRSQVFKPLDTAEVSMVQVMLLWDKTMLTLFVHHDLQLHDLRTNELMQHYTAHQGAVTDLAFHPSGNFLLSSSYDATLRVFDLREGQLFYTLHGQKGATTACCFSPSGDFFASGGADEQVMVWKSNFDRDLQDYVMAEVQVSGSHGVISLQPT
eukprot:scaffold240107_cov45-Prasinocladus_malaysianus.AAC.1